MKVLKKMQVTQRNLRLKTKGKYIQLITYLQLKEKYWKRSRTPSLLIYTLLSKQKTNSTSSWIFVMEENYFII